MGVGKELNLQAIYQLPQMTCNPFKNDFFYAKANKMHKNLTAITVPSANVLATQGSLQGAGCD